MYEVNNCACEENACRPSNLAEVKEPGIFIEMAEIINILTDISETLLSFKREITGELPEEKRGNMEPTSFKQSVLLAHMLAMGINSDLKELVKGFR